jgi:AcrR family transcriptional regulator
MGYSRIVPKVTDEHREQRRQQILSAAWDLFASNGFHQTSMAQIISATGLSAGAVYLYFRSKDDLIVATAEKALGAAHAAAGELLRASQPVAPGAAMARMVGQIQALQRDAGGVFFAVAIQAWAEAVRNPVIAATAKHFFAMLMDDLVGILQRWESAGHPLAGDPRDLARMMSGSIQGYIIQQAAFGAGPDDAYLARLGDRLTIMVTESPRR